MSAKEARPLSRTPAASTGGTGGKLASHPGPRAQAGEAGSASLEIDLG